MPLTHEVTQLLKAWTAGDPPALEKLTPLVYRELHRAAQRYMAGERPGHTLQTTALVSEVYLRLADCQQVNWQDRAHFFAVSAPLMRRILVDCARARGYQKRGGGAYHISCRKIIEYRITIYKTAENLSGKPLFRSAIQ